MQNGWRLTCKCRWCLIAPPRHRAVILNVLPRPLHCPDSGFDSFFESGFDSFFGSTTTSVPAPSTVTEKDLGAQVAARMR